MYQRDSITDRTRTEVQMCRRNTPGKSHLKKTQEQTGLIWSRSCGTCDLHSFSGRTSGFSLRTFLTSHSRKASDSHGRNVLGWSTMQLACLLLLCSLSAVSCRSVAKHECDPKKPLSCKFGATCQLQYGNHRMEEGVFRCVCPKIDCYSAGLFDPVCGEDGRTQKTHFNVLCLMLEECEMQRPIRQVCYGGCKSHACKVLTPETTHHTRCSSENAGYCLNGGLCVHHKLMNRASCRCPSDYEGERCDRKKLPEPGHVQGEGKCESKLGLLAIFAVVLLTLVLLFIVVCLCWRCRRTTKDEHDKLWPSVTTERDETTPLRDNTRSDYLFPQGPQKDSEK